MQLETSHWDGSGRGPDSVSTKRHSPPRTAAVTCCNSIFRLSPGAARTPYPGSRSEASATRKRSLVTSSPLVQVNWSPWPCCTRSVTASPRTTQSASVIDGTGPDGSAELAAPGAAASAGGRL